MLAWADEDRVRLARSQAVRRRRRARLFDEMSFLFLLVDETVVEVLAAEVSVAGRRLDLEDALFDGQDGYVEGAAAQVKDEDVFFAAAFFVKAVGDGGRGRLVDDAEHVEAGDGARVLGCLALRVVEVGGHGDHCVRDLFAQIGLGRLPHFGQHHGRDFFRVEALGLGLELDLDFGPAGVTDDPCGMGCVYMHGGDLARFVREISPAKYEIKAHKLTDLALNESRFKSLEIRMIEKIEKL
ncbi:NAD-specific glutamate dehydrogenase [Brachionus plicatilis]|uniref:NAD-specific glutamate dehydrogenase n=1 Tax=Brachionus plicatilis TaxID=10195 RepID=A0A3M7SZV6_BRAPC|nr:NAD-specific glutamate dehydrogenase [Brachionus plicatilis]